MGFSNPESTRTGTVMLVRYVLIHLLLFTLSFVLASALHFSDSIRDRSVWMLNLLAMFPYFVIVKLLVFVRMDFLRAKRGRRGILSQMIYIFLGALLFCFITFVFWSVFVHLPRTSGRPTSYLSDYFRKLPKVILTLDFLMTVVLLWTTRLLWFAFHRLAACSRQTPPLDRADDKSLQGPGLPSQSETDDEPMSGPDADVPDSQKPKRSRSRRLRRVFLILCGVGLLVAVSQFGQGVPFLPAPAPPDVGVTAGRLDMAATIEKVLSVPEEHIDVARAALEIERTSAPKASVVYWVQHLQEIARRIKPAVDKQASPQEKLALLSTYLHQSEGFEGILSKTDPTIGRLHKLLKSQKGDCLSLCLLYLSVADRLGLPLHLVAAPGHTYIRYDDGKTQFDIETTASGKQFPVGSYHIVDGKRRVWAHSRISDFYFRKLTKREVFGLILANQANILTVSATISEALRCYDKAIELNPQYAGAYNNRGYSYASKGDYDAAICDYTTTIKLNPKLAVAYRTRGSMYLNKGNYRAAIRDYAKAIELAPKDARGHRNRGIAFLNTGDYDAASRDFAKAIELRPADPRLHIWLFLTQARMGNDGKADLARFRKTEKDNKRISPVMRMYLGEITPDQCLAAATNKNTKLDNEQKCGSYFYVGQFYLIRGKNGTACEYFRKCVATNVRYFFEYTMAKAELKRLAK